MLCHPPNAPLILISRGSFFWKSLSSLRPLFHSCSQFRILSGKHISFWYDGWDGLPLLLPRNRPPTRRGLSLFDARNCTYNLLPAPLTFRQHSSYGKIEAIYPTQRPKQACLDNFLYRRFLCEFGIQDPVSSGKAQIADHFYMAGKGYTSMKCFFFLLLNYRIQTHDVMQRCHLNYTPGCVMCLHCPTETATHLFFQCPFAQTIWTTLSNIAGYQILKPGQTAQQTYLRSTPADKHLRKKWASLFITASWMLWKERNERTFQHRSTSASVLDSRIHQEADMCFKLC